jgi:hypothetical protein
MGCGIWVTGKNGIGLKAQGIGSKLEDKKTKGTGQIDFFRLFHFVFRILSSDLWFLPSVLYSSLSQSSTSDIPHSKPAE